ncbi:hypothetical protein HQ531_11825 [bacterium]|nr:hypothetical protein [bacterium]
MKRLQIRQDYLEKRYADLEQEFLSATDLARKDEIAKEKEKIEDEAPKLGETRGKLEAILPSLEEKNRTRLDNVKFDTLKFSKSDGK